MNNSTSLVEEKKSPLIQKEFTHCIRQSWFEQTAHVGKRKARAIAAGTIVSKEEAHKKENKNKALNWSITKFSLNPLLTEEMWNRHELSWNDRSHIISKADPHSLWKLALSEKFPITSSAIKPCLSNNDDLVRANKTVIMRKILEVYKKRYSESKNLPDKMIEEKDQHKPLLPVHEWSDELLNQLIQTCGNVITKKRYYPCVFEWKGIEILPYRIYKDYLQLVSVKTREKYIALYGLPDRFRTIPHTFYVGPEQIPYYDDAETFLVFNKNGLHEWETNLDPLPPLPTTASTLPLLSLPLIILPQEEEEQEEKKEKEEDEKPEKRKRRKRNNY